MFPNLFSVHQKLPFVLSNQSQYRLFFLDSVSKLSVASGTAVRKYVSNSLLRNKSPSAFALGEKFKSPEGPDRGTKFKASNPYQK